MRFIALLAFVLALLIRDSHGQEIDLKLPEVDRHAEFSTGLMYGGMGLSLFGAGMVLAGQLNKEPVFKRDLTIIGSSVAGAGALLSFSAVIPIETLRKKIRKRKVE